MSPTGREGRPEARIAHAAVAFVRDASVVLVVPAALALLYVTAAVDRAAWNAGGLPLALTAHAALWVVGMLVIRTALDRITDRGPCASEIEVGALCGGTDAAKGASGRP